MSAPESSDGGGQGPAQPPRPHKLVLAALVDAHYRRLVAQPDLARSRAQAGYGIASALATALLASLIFSKLGDARTSIRTMAVVSVAAWALAAGVFLWTVAAEVNPQLPESRRAEASDFVDYVLVRSKYERETIDHRQWWARVASLVAAAFTVATVALAAAPHSTTQSVYLSLTERGRNTVAGLCGGRKLNVIQGRLDPAQLLDSYVSVQVGAGVCSRRAATLHLPREAVAGVVRN